MSDWSDEETDDPLYADEGVAAVATAMKSVGIGNTM
jgi:hypothetical protein